MEKVHVNTTADVKVFIEEGPLMRDDFGCEERKNYSNPVEATSFTTEELSDVGSRAKIVNVECMQDKVIGSQAYEYTSAGVEVFIKEEPHMLEDFDSEECENYSRTVEGTSSITDVRTTATTIKEEYVQDAYNNEQMLNLGELCETVYAADHQESLHPSENKPQEEFILPDVIHNIHSIEQTFKKEPVSCEVTTEASKKSSSEASVEVLNPRICEDYTLGDINSEDCKTGEGECGNKLRNKEELRQTLTNTLPHQCNICERNFRFESNLKKHMQSHMNVRVYVCDECGKNYSKKYVLRHHMLIHKRPHQCEACKKTFTHLAKLKVHMRKHTGEKPYPCTHCERRFRTEHNLVIHMRMHTGEKPFPCTVCEKRFGKKYLLVKHMRTHTGEKPYPCTVCGKCCSRKDNLVEHMRTHTGEKPYSCAVCEKRFSIRKVLLEHMRTHTGDKPYPCTVCEKRYSRKENLVEHIRTHTGEKPYQCTVCKTFFSIKKSLVEHMRVHM